MTDASKPSPALATQLSRTALHVPTTGEPTAPSIPQNTAWTFRSAEEADAQFSRSNGNELYARLGTPLHAAIEDALAGMEGVDAGCLFATGMAALACALDVLLPPGSTLLASRDLYGTTDVYLDLLARERGVKLLRADLSDRSETDAALAQKPTLLLLEVLTNPTLKVLPLDALAARAHAAGARVMVDATFTPAPILRVATLGADIVHHSASKSLAGHGDVSAGVVLGPADVMAKVRSRRGLTGPHLGAMEAWLLARGLRTLHLRAQQAGLNALHLAHRLEHLRAHGALPAVQRVFHPALPGHPGGDWLLRQSGGHGGMMVGVELESAEHALRMVKALDGIRLVASLGEVTTTVSIPARSSHRGVPPAERARRGITDGFVRISVGMEEASDICADLENALRASSVSP
jgi:cystathionine beta-lyase/cystathionine gamma-synthase